MDAMTTREDFLAAGGLYDELAPILREMMATATEKLDALEKDGTLAFGAELVQTGGKVLAEALQQAQAAKPIGLMGVARAARDPEVQKGLAVVIELLRHVGRAANARNGTALAVAATPLATKRAKLDAVTGRRRVAAPERRLPPPAPAAAAACATTVATATQLADAAAWTPELGSRVAAGEGIALSGEHWKVIEFARGDFAATGVSPNIRRITQGMGITTKDLYTLFPKAPGRTLAKIAGLPKPAGCL
jgi:dissimilatory sulfite reductase related protein